MLTCEDVSRHRLPLKIEYVYIFITNRKKIEQRDKWTSFDITSDFNHPIDDQTISIK
jgi:hypothetical protein